MLTHEVVNISQGASSNTESLNRLTLFLKRFSVDCYDTIYWIVTCPSRCVTPEYYIANNNHTVLENSYKILYDSLEKANILGKQHNITIKLIGGLCDLDSIPIQNYSNLEICVPSWGRLLNSSYNSGILYPAYWKELGLLIKSTCPELLLEWIHITEQIQNKDKSWKEMSNTYFSTDARHPDRYGHRVLRDYLYPEFSYKV
jgi:hypothetical protein